MLSREMQKQVKEDRYNRVAFPEEGGFLKDGFLHAGVCLVFLLNIMNELMLIRCLMCTRSERNFVSVFIKFYHYILTLKQVQSIFYIIHIACIYIYIIQKEAKVLLN